MWCELVLNGVGGPTIAEAKERMGHDELAMWIAYRRKHGTFNLGARIEQGAALTAYCANHRNGELADYMPSREVAVDAPDVALARAMKEWR